MAKKATYVELICIVVTYFAAVPLTMVPGAAPFVVQAVVVHVHVYMAACYCSLTLSHIHL